MGKLSREMGISCWPTGNSRGCDQQFTITRRKGEKYLAACKRLEQEAGEAGWCIGHWDGQGYFVCPDHKESVWEAIPLSARTPERLRGGGEAK